MTRPRLLYCSPVLPALSGNGLAMRAGTILRALSDRFDVSLLVVPLYPSPAMELPAAIAERCRQVVVGDREVPDPASLGDASPKSGRLWWQLWRPSSRPELSSPSAFRDDPFDVVHVFRLATVERVRQWLQGGGRPPSRHLDLDDVESVTRLRIAERYTQTGRPDLAAMEREAAARALAAEAGALGDFDRVYVCSDGDRRLLEARRGLGAGADIEVLPNSVSSPASVREPPGDGPFTFLFVGTLGYFPNEDAIVTFCRETLPALRRMATRPFRILVVGAGATPAVQALASIPEVEVVGAVSDVSEWYWQSHAATVPVRAGGGTRIKILEAFAHHRPVVTTTVGVEGIAAIGGEHVLIADEPAAFARACARLIASPGLAARLATNAAALFQAEYSPQALSRRIAALP